MQTQTSNTLHNAIMEAGSKDRPPMLASAATRNRGKAIVNSPQPIYDQAPSMVAEDDETSKDKSAGYENQRVGNVAGARETVGLTVVQKYGIQCYNCKEYGHVARECQKPKRAKDAAYHREKMLLCKQEEAGIQLNAKQADWTDDTNDELEDQELEAHYIEEIDRNDDDNDLANERKLLASLIEKLKCEIDESKNCNKFLKTSNKVLVKKLKGEIKDFKNKNKSLESSNNRFKEANNKLSETNNLLYTDFKKSEAELARRISMEYASKMEIECAQVRGDFLSYKMESQKSFNKYTQTINDLNQTILEMKNKLSAHQETVSILSQQKEAHIILYKTREDKELDEVIALENKVKSKMMSKCFEALQKQAINFEIDLEQCQEKIKNEKSFKENMSKEFRKEHEQYFEIQDLKAQLHKGIVIRVILTTSVSRPQLKSNPMGDKVMRNNSQRKKQEVEYQRRNVKLSKNKTSITACNDSLNDKTLNVNFFSTMSDKCVLNDKHDICVLNSVAEPHKKTVASESNQKPRNITRKLYEHVSKTCCWWYTKFTPSGYKCKPKSGQENVNPNLVEIVLFIVDSGCSKHMMGNLKLLINFEEKFLGTVKFRSDQIAPILGYGDLVQGAVTLKMVYYIEGLNHNLFFVGQFCDADLEVAFRKSTCYICDLKGNDLLTSSRGTYLYSITLQDTNCPNLIYLMAKVTSSQAGLWHRRLSHLNFDTINLLSKNDIVVGLPKLKFIKDHLCSSCELGKAKRKSFHIKIIPSLKRRLQLLHIDLCGPMRVAIINGKIYILVNVDDYSRYTWTHFLRSKDETPKVLIDFLGLSKEKGFFTKRQLLEHLNKTTLSKDETEHLLRLLEQC
nr:retrovirus-related Pol polyprotein from transposon TNT 1-94 [Tanacetum cinerariifolium]